MALGKLLAFFQKHPIYIKESYLELENYASLRRGEIKVLSRVGLKSKEFHQGLGNGKVLSK